MVDDGAVDADRFGPYSVDLAETFGVSDLVVSNWDRATWTVRKKDLLVSRVGRTSW